MLLGNLATAFLLAATAAAAPAVSEADASSTLRVMTFNVWHGLRSGESNKRFPGEDAERAERRFRLQIEEIQRLDPDVLLFQEVNPNQRRARRYAEALGYDEIHKITSCGVHLGKIYKIPRNVNEGLAILARPELDLRPMGTKRLSGNARCSASWGFQTRESRYGLLGKITVDGRPVVVTTTHLSSPPFVPPGFEQTLDDLVQSGGLQADQRETILTELERKRGKNLAEAELLMAQIDKRREKLGQSGKAPALLGGDFNATRDSASIVAIENAGMQNAAAGPGFLTWDPVANHANFEIGSNRKDRLPTFDVAEIQQMLALRLTTPRQIDFIFVSDEVEVVAAERVMDDERDGIYLSDHFAILVTVRLP